MQGSWKSKRWTFTKFLHLLVSERVFLLGKLLAYILVSTNVNVSFPFDPDVALLLKNAMVKRVIDSGMPLYKQNY